MENSNNDMLIAEALIRLKALENLLISKGVFTEQELKAATKDITDILALTVLQKANVPGDHSKILEDLGK